MSFLFAPAGRVLLLCLSATAASCKVSPVSTAPMPTVRSASAAGPAHLESVPRTALCVSEGSLSAASESKIRVNAGGMRAVLSEDRSNVAELEFEYRGPSTTTVPLASGELRRQVGLKLRAKDTCNVIYVMWHVSPTPGVHVSVKQNRGERYHSQCGDGGYVTPKAESSKPTPPMMANAPNLLRAELDGSTLRVAANGTEVWRGTLPVEALAFEGPVGVRTDNGIFDFELRVPHGASAAGNCL